MTAVVLMAYGTPRSLDELESYYTHIRRGRAPTPEQLDELRSRYEAIGGVSPLLERTEAQRAAVQAALDSAEPGRYATVVGMKHAAPFVEDAVGAVADDHDEIVGLVLAPHYSAASVGEYATRLATAARERGVDQVATVRSWHLEPALLDALAARLRGTLAGLPSPARVLFTAHSLPERVLADGDPYRDQVTETARAVAERVGLADTAWSVCWQSAGRTPEPWLGPDVLEEIDEVATGGASTSVAVCPCGFVSDHLEVLYDLDVDACRAAEARGLAFGRTASIDDDPSVMEALAGLVRRHAS